MPRFAQMACIAGYGRTPLGKLGMSATELMKQSLESALSSASLCLKDLDGLIAVPSLSDPHFMEAHALATSTGLLPQQNVMVRTLDTGGAGPVSGVYNIDSLHTLILISVSISFFFLRSL